jgi:protoporphyrinogen oxidase
MSRPGSSRIAVIGGGITGISFARLASGAADVTVFERATRAGGLVRCDWVDGRLFHRVGGHVFNTRNAIIRDWFWSHFDRDTEFIAADRRAAIWLGGRQVGYPVENHLHQLPADVAERAIGELLDRVSTAPARGRCANFRDFLREAFGPTLYELYFRPYNEKIWRADLGSIPLDWLEGKLPMPDVREILISGVLRRGEGGMVHRTFYYPRRGGSQFIVDRLAAGLDLRTGVAVDRLHRTDSGWELNGEAFDEVVYCGDVRELGRLVSGIAAPVETALAAFAGLRANGTSNLFCECDETNLTWLYLPGPETRAHRIIFTGSLSPENNGAMDAGRSTCVVEFSGSVSADEMAADAAGMPGRLRPLAHNHAPLSYVLQDEHTRAKVAAARSALAPLGLHLLGRFAEWEYHNMDKCMESAAALAQARGWRNLARPELIPEVAS